MSMHWKPPAMALGLLLAAASLIPTPASASLQLAKVGLASFYSTSFHGKCCTASGERVNVYDYTAAHRTLPFGSRVKVTNLLNHRSVVVRINDRGPYHGSRIIDLSKAAFDRIAVKQNGVVRVRLDVLSAPGKAKVSMLPVMSQPHIRP
ncbi:MAG TPA: septal ring lytic transglycosylase RlpA family protein [Candidatus Obscuribacterales bacterium]